MATRSNLPAIPSLKTIGKATVMTYLALAIINWAKARFPILRAPIGG